MDFNGKIDLDFEELAVVFVQMGDSLELNFKDLSMGMSGDFLDAVKNNATYLRIGSKIFGSRD